METINKILNKYNSKFENNFTFKHLTLMLVLLFCVIAIAVITDISNVFSYIVFLFSLFIYYLHNSLFLALYFLAVLNGLIVILDFIYKILI